MHLVVEETAMAEEGYFAVDLVHTAEVLYLLHPLLLAPVLGALARCRWPQDVRQNAIPGRYKCRPVPRAPSLATSSSWRALQQLKRDQ